MDIMHWVNWVRQRWKRLLLGVLALCAFYFALLWLTLPDVSDPRILIASQSTVITDRNNIELYRLYAEEDRTFIAGETIPLHAKRAMIAIEDERFYDHGCLDFRSILRAIFANVFGGFKSQGASTLTQQLARNALLTREKRFTRKFREIMLACKMERVLSKDQILELYLNWIPFGQHAYGIEQASHTYFSTSATDLTIAQAAVLAALPQRPSYFSPYGAHLRTQVTSEVRTKIDRGEIAAATEVPADAIQIGLIGQTFGSGTVRITLSGRTEQVLRKMEELGFITETTRLQALEELTKLTFQPSREDIRAPHFVLWVREQVEELLGAAAGEDVLLQGGLQIETTLDWKLQQAAESVVAFHREDMAQRFNAWNIALVALDPATREILAYIGNSDFGDEEHEGKVDMARAPRQPGSSFKPLVYAAAFQSGYGPATILYDVETKFGEDIPQNFDGQFWGLMNIRRALAASRNIPAVKAFFLAGGEDPILELAARMGVTTPQERKQALLLERGSFDYGWPLGIGAAETPLLEMVHGYSTLADAGRFTPLRTIRRITDKKGALLYEAEEVGVGEEVLDPRIAYEISSILSDVQARPNEYWQSVLSIPGMEAAAKTGTSNKCMERMEGSVAPGNTAACKTRRPDNTWTIGYTPVLAAGVWVGNATSEPLFEKAESLTTAAPIWRDFMMKAHKILQPSRTTFIAPSGIVRPQISLLSGELPTECTPVNLRRAEVFLEESAPELPDPACAFLTVDKVTGLLASKTCPAEAQETQGFLIPGSILPERWPFWDTAVKEWARKQMELWKATPNHSGALLPLPIAPTEECDPALTPGRLVKPTLEILYPEEGGYAPLPSFQPQIDFTVGSSVRAVTYSIDGKNVATVASGSDLMPPLRVPRSLEEEGTHTLSVTLTDQYYNAVTKEVKFRFGKDEDAPTVRILSPRDGAMVRKGEVLRIRAEAKDREGGVKHVQFFLGEILLSTKPQDPYELDYTVNEEPGTYVLRATAIDLAKNSSEDTVTITVEP